MVPPDRLYLYTSNPSTPTKTNNTKGSLKTLFSAFYFPPFFP